MVSNIINLKLVFFTIVNVWLLYLISTRIELEKICITSDWLDYLMYLLEIENPTINVQLLVLFGVFGIFLKLIKSVRIGVSILMVFMSKILYKVHDKFLTCGEDISFWGLTMEHVMSIKEKLTLLKNYIKTNNIVIDNEYFLVVWNAIKSLKKENEVMETIKQMLDEFKQKQPSNLEYMYSLLTVPNIMIIVAGVAGLIYIGYWGYSKLINIDLKFDVNLKYYIEINDMVDKKVEDIQQSINITQKSVEIKFLELKEEDSLVHQHSKIDYVDVEGVVFNAFVKVII